MKEYQIEVTSVTTVYVEANNKEEALDKAYEQAYYVQADINQAKIVDVTDLED